MEANEPAGSGGGGVAYPACAADADCPAEERCDGGTCRPRSTCTCGEGLDCDASGECRRVCGGHADCYADEAYCAIDGLCYGVVFGGQDWSCQRAEIAPPRDLGGPLIFDLSQVDASPDAVRCVKDPRCTNDGNVCTFELAYFDPDGDVPATPDEAYLHLAWIGADGEPGPMFEVPLATETHLRFTLCFEAALETVGGAVQLSDRAGRRSNAQCFEGSAP